MNPNQTELGPALLARLPDPTELPELRAAAVAAVERERTRLHRRRIFVQVFWIFCAVMTTAYMWFGPDADRVSRSPFLACFFFLWGAVELLKHRIHASRVEVLTELKLIELRITELLARPSTPQ